jgi:hypothetical protein
LYVRVLCCEAQQKCGACCREAVAALLHSVFCIIIIIIIIVLQVKPHTWLLHVWQQHHMHGSNLLAACLSGLGQ